MTKYVYDEHFTQKDYNKLVKGNIYMISQLHISTKYYNSETERESRATGIQVFLKNNLTNATRRGVSDDYGQLTFYDVPAGEYTLTGVDSTKVYGDAVKQIVLKKNRETDYDLILYTPFVPEAKFNLFDSETNEPIPDLELTISNGDYQATTKSDNDGVCIFKNVPTRMYTARTKPTPYYDRYSNMFDINPAHYEFDCIVQSHRIKKFKVLVEDSLSESEPLTPIANADIKIHHNDSGQEFTGVSGSDGTYTFSNIINGKYTVSLLHQDYRADDQTITARTQEEGDVEHLGMKSKYGDCEIIVKDSETEEPIADVNLKMVSSDEGIPTLTVTTGEDGIAHLENVYIGKYNILATNKYYEDTFTVVELDHNASITVFMDVVELDNIRFKVVNKYGNKELLDHKEVQFFKKANPSEEDTPDYTVEVEDGYTNTFIIPAGKYTVKFHDLDNAYDWVSDEYMGQFPDRFLYNVDLNKTTQEMTYEWEGDLLPELKLLCFNVGGGRVKNYNFHFQSESPYGMTGFLTSDDDGNISIKHNMIYGSKVRVYCYDTGTHNNEIIFDEEFVIDIWDEDYVKEITIGARHIPTYAIKLMEPNGEGRANQVVKGGTQVIVKNNDEVPIMGTVDGTNGVVLFNNILKEEEDISVRLNSNIYAGFYASTGFVDVKYLVTHYDYADTPDDNRTLVAGRYSISMDVLVRNKNNISSTVTGATVKVIHNEDVLGAQDYNKTTALGGRASLSSVVAGNYSYEVSREYWKTTTGSFDLTIADAGDTKIIDIEQEITITVNVTDQFGLTPKKATITATGGGKTYTESLTNGVGTLKVNNTGKYTVTITSDDEDDVGNKVFDDFSGQFTIPEGTTSAPVSYTLNRKTGNAVVTCYFRSSKQTSYDISIVELSAKYEIRGYVYSITVPAGVNLTYNVKWNDKTGSLSGITNVSSRSNFEVTVS